MHLGLAVRQSPDTYLLVALEGCIPVLTMVFDPQATTTVTGLDHSNLFDSMHWSNWTIVQTMSHYLETIVPSNAPCILRTQPMDLLGRSWSCLPKDHVQRCWH